MLTVAATVYTVDQNEPSRPFLLNLPIDSQPDEAQILEALITEMARIELESVEHDPDLLKETLESCEITARCADGQYGDYQAETNSDSVYLFVTLPPNTTISGRMDHPIITRKLLNIPV
jgi:hypothetical protein